MHTAFIKARESNDFEHWEQAWKICDADNDGMIPVRVSNFFLESSLVRMPDYIGRMYLAYLRSITICIMWRHREDLPLSFISLRMERSLWKWSEFSSLSLPCVLAVLTPEYLAAIVKVRDIKGWGEDKLITYQGVSYCFIHHVSSGVHE